MQRPRIHLRTLMMVIAASAVLAWIARSQDGRISLLLGGLITVLFATGIGLGVLTDRIVRIHERRDREK